MNNYKIMLNIQFNQLLFKFDVCDYYNTLIFQFKFFFNIDFRRFFMQFFIFNNLYKRFAFSLISKLYLKFTIENISKKQKITILKQFC